MIALFTYAAVIAATLVVCAYIVGSKPRRFCRVCWGFHR